jgi:hypothetical protein
MVAMIKCPFCQFENEDGVLFCEQCKLDLGAAEPVAKQSADHSSAMAMADASAAPTAAVAEVAGPPVAVAVAEAGVAPAAEMPIALAVPLPESPPLTFSGEPPLAVSEAAPAWAPQAPHSSPLVEAVPATPAAPTSPDTTSPLTATQPETTAPAAAAEPPERLPPDTKPKLVVLRGQRLSVEYPLYDGDNYLGRADEKAVDIDLEDQEPPDRIWSSRQHALITYENGMLTIEDLNSTNGTFVNRLRVHPGQKRPLQINDIIQIGTVQMKVKI